MRGDFTVELEEFYVNQAWGWYDYTLKIKPAERLTPAQRDFIQRYKQEITFALQREQWIKQRNQAKQRGESEDQRRFCHECQHFKPNTERCNVTRIKQIIDNVPMHCKNFLAIEPSNQTQLGELSGKQNEQGLGKTSSIRKNTNYWKSWHSYRVQFHALNFAESIIIFLNNFNA